MVAGMTFRVGQKVVCVDAGADFTGQATNLVQDQIYEIENVVATLTMIGLVVAGAYSWHETRAYRATRFRPIAERKTDISFAHEILRKTSRKAGVNA